MNVTSFLRVLPLCVIALHASAAPSDHPGRKPGPAATDLQAAVDAAKAVAELKASIAARKKAVADAYKAAAKLRHNANIIDPDPEGDGVVIVPEGDPNVIAYVAAKKEYFKARAALQQAEQALLAARPIAELREDIAAAEKEVETAFAEVTQLLKAGDVSDPDPNNPRSVISIASGDKKAAAHYVDRKANYLAQKARLKKTRDALNDALEKRKVPPSAK